MLAQKRAPGFRHIGWNVSIAAFESELGVQAPVGFWDPMGLAKDGDQETFKRRRATELKHGRVAMLATMGYILPEYFRFPGYLSPSANIKFSDVPNGLEAFSKVPLNGWFQIVVFAGFYEFPTYNSDRAPGDLGWKAITSSDPDTLQSKLNAELANGRLAMVAIMGMLFQNGTVGSTGPEMWLASGAFEGELGVQPPLGFWDPAGLAKSGDAGEFRRRRESELKHGRISMAACIGYITPEYFKFPGYLSPSLGLRFEDVPNGLGALSQVPSVGLLQMFLFAGLIDFGYFQQDPQRDPGDFENGGILGVPNGSGPMKDAEARRRKLSAELANGRLAMMAIIGMFFQDGLTGSAWGDWDLYTDSPLRAFENELGVQAPLGFWDPLGLSKDGDTDAFRRRRMTEIKHGRVSMLACLGYIVPEYVTLPGYCSPSSGLSFQDVPKGLAALSKLPGAGLTQMFLFAGVVETGLYKQDEDRAPGDFENGGVLGVPNGSKLPLGEARTRKLNAEIANGRLAMMAIIGMFFQDGLTGSAWGNWELYTDSPLRAVTTVDAEGRYRFITEEQSSGDSVWSREIGATLPLCNTEEGMTRWDPCGFTSGKRARKFNAYRAAEVKHGRVAMLAIVGLVVQHYVRFAPLATGEGVFDLNDVPSNFGAISTFPSSAGFGVFVLLAGFVELRASDKGRAPGDFGDILNWRKEVAGTIPDDALLQTYELEHGRLAMLGVMGTFAAEYVTNYDAVEQWQHAVEGAGNLVRLTLIK